GSNAAVPCRTRQLLRFARLDPRAFNELCHAWQVSDEQARVRLGRQLLVREWQGSELLQLLHELWLGERRAERRIQRAYRLLWRALCHVESMPHRIADLGHAELG